MSLTFLRFLYHLIDLQKCVYKASALWSCIQCIASRQRRRSATRHQLIVPRHRRSRFGRRAFSVGGPTGWNLLPDHLRDLSLSIGSFRSALKTFLFTTHRDTYSVVEALCVMRYTSRQSSSSSSSLHFSLLDSDYKFSVCADLVHHMISISGAIFETS